MDELTQLLERLEREWAPEVLELAARIVFWDAVGWLAIGALCAVVAIVAGRITIRHYRYVESDEYSYPSDEWRIPVAMGSGIIATFASLCASFILLNIWNYIALFDARLAVAHRVLELLLRGVK